VRRRAEVVQLAELLGLPVAGGGEFGVWSKPFPTRNALYLDRCCATCAPGRGRSPAQHRNQYGEVYTPGGKLVSIRRDPTSLGRVSPIDMGLVADSKLAAADLVAAVKSLATPDRLRKIAEDRGARVRDYTAGMAKMRMAMLNDFPAHPVARSRSSACVRTRKRTRERHDLRQRHRLGQEDGSVHVVRGHRQDVRRQRSEHPRLGMSAALGAKLARPDRPVVAVLGDGAFLFGGPQPLWSQARYNVPVTNIVLNNFSYNNERNRIWTFVSGQQFKSGLDMTCYNGSPTSTSPKHHKPRR